MNLDPQAKPTISSQEPQINESVIDTIKFEELSIEEHNYDEFGWYPD